MGNKFTKYLKSAVAGAVAGATNPKGLCANWQHATRVFVDDTYRLSPHTKFLYYVHFDINDLALKSTAWDKQTHGRELGMLVKRSALPKFSLDTITKNQYNRKKILHKTLKYDPVQLAFHDDSNAIVSSLWALYYGYYVADRHLQQLDYRYNQYDADLIQRYGLDNNVGTSGEKRPFFNSIQVFTMSRRRFIGYTLVNPRITNWAHGDVDYEASDTIESTMTIEYENVIYSSGDVTQGTPEGFAELHYDHLPSPLTVQGGGVENLLGEGGVLDGAAQIFGDIGSGVALDNPASFIGTAIKAANTIKNANNLSLDGIKSEALGALAPIAVGAAGSAMGALGGMFPKTGEATTEATAKSTPANVRDLQAAEAATAAAEAATAANSRSTQSSSLAAAEAASIPVSNPNVDIDWDAWGKAKANGEVVTIPGTNQG